MIQYSGNLCRVILKRQKRKCNNMVKLSLVLGFILVLSCVSAEELCLRQIPDIKADRNSTVCTIPARKATKDDIDKLVIMCKIASGVFPFDPRGGNSGPRIGNGIPYGEPRPYLELHSSTFEYRDSLKFEDCKKVLNFMSDQIFWVSKFEIPDNKRKPDLLVGREFSVNDTSRSNTCLGLVNVKNPERSFQCIRRDDFENQYQAPFGYEFLTIRYPENYVVNVTDIVSTEEAVEIDHVDMGYFSYYNPSEFDQVIEVFLDNKEEVTYNNFDFIALSSTNLYINDGESQIFMKTVKDLVPFSRIKMMQVPLQTKRSIVPFNITIPALTSLTARIVGKQMTAEIVFKGIRNDEYEDGTYVPEAKEIEGSKSSSYISGFYLEDAQVHHTYEVMVLSYSTIYVALMCLGVVLLAGLVVFTVRCAIKRFRRRPEVPYSVINEQAS